MKTAQIVLTCFFICVFLSVSVSFSQTTSIKVQNFLKVIQAATSLAEVKAAFDKADFSQSEIDQLKKVTSSSPTLTQKIQQLYNQAFALMKPRMDQNRQAALANLQVMKTKYVETLQQKTASIQTALQTILSCESDTPVIDSILGDPIEPGVLFIVRGKRLGETPGSIDLMVGGFIYRAYIDSWKNCGVSARLSPEISGVRASNYATLVLRTAGGNEINKITSFQPLLEYNYLYNTGNNYDSNVAVNALRAYGGGSKDWRVNDFQLKNDWFVRGRDFFVETALKAHAEITYASALNYRNGIARTDVHAGWNAFSDVTWELYTYLSGPKGLAY